MPVDRDDLGSQEWTPTKISHAAYSFKASAWFACACGLTALLLLLLVTFLGDTTPIWRPMGSALAAALLVAHVGALNALAIARLREQRSSPAMELARIDALVSTLPAGRWRRRIAVASLLLKRIPRDLVFGLWLSALALGAAVAVMLTWNLAIPPSALASADYLAGGSALLLAFGLLVLERQLSGTNSLDWPEAPSLVPFARVALLVALVIAANGLLVPADGLWRTRIAVFVGLLPAAVSVEMFARLLLSLFVRADAREEPRMVATSLLAQMLRWPPRPLSDLQEELRSRFGIDLRQNWAFGYIGRAFLPVVACVLGIGWLLSGVREIPADARAVHERFGKPVEIWTPGVHLGLPWPFSRTRAVDNGVVRTLAIALSDDAPATADTSTADGPAPDSANRLWDVSHVSEKSQVIAREAGDRQSFEVVYMDVRFIYRIGLSDAAALAATYNTADLPALIRSTASRVLVEDFATRTLDGVLGETREALARDIGRRVQADLDAADSGVELLATLIEAVHPPAGAANAYHSVQAAQIRTQAAVARERGRSAEESNEARMQAAMKLDKATAGARELIAAAQAAELRFSAERDAYRSAGAAFVLEQYLAQLSQGLANTRLVLLDHRMRGGAEGPTVDLRVFAPQGLASAP